MTEVAVRVLRTLARSRPTPSAKTAASRGLGVVALHDAHAAERLGEAAGHLGVDLAALAEDRAACVRKARKSDGAERPASETKVTAVMTGLSGASSGQGEGGGEQAARELHQAGADEVPDALHVVHDPGHERARLVARRSRPPGAGPTCAWTLRRISAMSRCAALERSWVSAKEVAPCTRVARPRPRHQGSEQVRSRAGRSRRRSGTWWRRAARGRPRG